MNRLNNKKSRLHTDETGAATAEYVVATIAAVGFATLLVAILKSPEVHDLLLSLVRQALSVKV
ncbi:MAG: hypothetical protein RJA35_1339 [Actinomycetota bacterium]